MEFGRAWKAEEGLDGLKCQGKDSREEGRNSPRAEMQSVLGSGPGQI